MPGEYPQAYDSPGVDVEDRGNVETLRAVFQVGEVRGPGSVFFVGKNNQEQIRIRGLGPMIPLFPGFLRPAAVGLDAEEFHHPPVRFLLTDKARASRLWP